MTQKPGCNFCTRRGLAILPVRPGIKSQDDCVPDFPATITPPAIPAQGETAYTVRLLREGFLYVWNGMAKRWINYYATKDGYYYPLPYSGEISPRIVSGELKPCITQPEELARASLITLPLLPLGMKNGEFWFAWSEVEWTPEVRKKHEDAAYRSRYMQHFDMDAWLGSGKADNAVAISTLTQTVAEYSSKADYADVREWTPADWRRVNWQNGSNLMQAAESLSPGKGAILVLQDPVALVKDISALSNYRLDKHFAHNPKYSRGLALSFALSALKDALCTQFERDQLSLDIGMEQQAQSGLAVKAGIMSPALAGMQSTALYDHNNVSLAQQKKIYWDQYEKYIDRTKESAFLAEYDQARANYGQQIITPMVAMYLDWLKASSLLDYFDHNFDPEDIHSCALFTQTVTYCVQDMQDKPDAVTYFLEQLSAPSLTARNILLRAAVLNNTNWTLQISNAVSGKGGYDDLPWDKLGDGLKDIIGHSVLDTQFVLEGYLNAISSAVLGLLNKAATQTLLPALVALTSTYGKALKTVSFSGQRKHFISAVVRQLGEMTDLDSRVSASQLRHYVEVELRRLSVSGIPMEGELTSKYLVLIDTEEAVQLRSVPEAGRAQAAAKTLRTADEVGDALFPRAWRQKLALAKGSTLNKLANDGAQSLPFAGCLLSVAFQIHTVTKTVEDAVAGKVKDIESVTKLVANTLGAGGALLDAVERIIYRFRSFRLKPLVRLYYGQPGIEKLATFLERGMKFCAWFGWVAVGWDLYHAYDEGINKNNSGLGVAYFISATSGGVLTYAALSSSFVLGPVGLAIVLICVFGSAIYIALQEKDEIQKWLAAIWWRQVPENERAAPMWPNSEMEMSALKSALGQEGA